MKKAVGIVWLLALAGAQAVSAFQVRDPVNSLWSDQPVKIDGHTAEWKDSPVLDEEGYSFRAMNDSSTLYLLIRGANNEGGMELSGRYRQNVTVWFVKPDEATRTWGINLDFTHVHPADISSSTARGDSGSPLVSFASVGVAPEMVIPKDLELSTATLPAAIEIQADLSRQHDHEPLFEIAIPLSMIEHQGDFIYADFVTSAATPDVMAELQSGRQQQGSEDGGEDSSGGGGRHHHGGGSQGGKSEYVEPPNPVDLHLEIDLTKNPHH